MQTLWNNISVNECPRCHHLIEENELDFCYPITRDKSRWEAGCPFCHIFVESDSMEHAIELWNLIDHEFIKEFELEELEFVKNFEQQFNKEM